MQRSPISERPVNYMGIKSRALDEISEVIADSCPPNTPVVDLFAGSGVVSRRLAARNPVTSVDIQEYSRVLSSALGGAGRPPSKVVSDFLEEVSTSRHLNSTSLQNLCNIEETALSLGDDATIASLIYSTTLPDVDSSQILTKYYGGVYFSFAQAVAMDSIQSAIANLPVEFRDIPRAALLGVASDLVTSVGSHFAQPVRATTSDGSVRQGVSASIQRRRSLNAYELFSDYLNRYLTLTPTPNRIIAVRDDYRNFLSKLNERVVIYADPPYTRDHYSRFYHVLETIARADDPGVTTDASGIPSRGRYRLDRHQSPFSIISQSKRAFEVLFEQAARCESILVLSYSPANVNTPARKQSRVQLVSDLQDLATGYFGSVTMIQITGVTHSKFNRRELNGEIDPKAEILLLCR